MFLNRLRYNFFPDAKNEEAKLIKQQLFEYFGIYLNSGTMV